MITWLEDYARVGWPSSQTTLRRRVSAFVRTGRSKRFKVGLTNKPAVRAGQYSHAGLPYTRMVLLYKTTSHKHAQRIESWLIDLYKNRCDNLRGGGAGPNASGLKYVYVVLV